jgi:hypothetical protein
MRPVSGFPLFNAGEHGRGILACVYQQPTPLFRKAQTVALIYERFSRNFLVAAKKT